MYYIYYINLTLNKWWKWSSCTKLALSASWIHGLIAQSKRASERNSVVVSLSPTRANFLYVYIMYVHIDNTNFVYLFTQYNRKHCKSIFVFKQFLSDKKSSKFSIQCWLKMFCKTPLFKFSEQDITFLIKNMHFE